MCTVLVDGTPMKTCTMFAVQADGRSLTTVEGLSDVGVGHAAGVQGGARPAVRVLHAGMMLVGVALLAAVPRPHRRRGAAGDGATSAAAPVYMNIVKAIRAAAAEGGGGTTAGASA